MRKLKRLDKAARRIRTFLETHEERMGAGGEPVKSNVTDNESGKIKGPHGVIQGCDGLAVADRKKQVIGAAQANGSAAEGQYFADALDETARNLHRVTGKRKPLAGGNGIGGHGVFQRGQSPGGQSAGHTGDNPR